MTDASDARTARADARAAKARAKALRPWYKKKRWWALGVLVIIIVAAIAGSAGSGKNTGRTTGVSTLSTNSQYPPQRDVTLSTCDNAGFGLATVGGTIVNHSPKNSDYVIEVRLLQGSTRVGEATDAENNVGAHQQSTWQTSGTISGGSPGASITCQLVSVDRFAATS